MWCSLYIPRRSTSGSHIPRFVHRLLLLCLVFFGGCILPAFAQDASNSPSRVTLEGWVHDIRVAVWDRAGTDGGRYSDRGVFRYRSPRMDHEYDLDMFTADFTLAEDADFFSHESGFRGHATSVTTLDLASATHIRALVPMGNQVGFRFDADLQDDFRAKRLALQVGYEFGVSDGHVVGFTHSLSKAKADMDWGLYYRYEGSDGLNVEAEVVALDGINNIITGQKVSPFNRDTVRTYRTAPFMFAGRISAPIVRRIRGEAAFGVQTRSVADVRSLNSDSLRFTHEDALWYAGLLVEIDAWPEYVTAGGVAQITSTSATRSADATALDPAEYTTRQPFSRLGVFALSRIGRVRAETWMYYDHYTDEQKGVLFGGSSVDGPYLFEDKRLWLQTEVGVLASFNLETSLSYQADLRSYPSGEGLDDRFLGFIPHRPNHRMTMKLSYHFSELAVFDWGLSFDLDNDHFFMDPASRSRYDGMYFRLRSNW